MGHFHPKERPITLPWIISHTKEPPNHFAFVTDDEGQEKRFLQCPTKPLRLTLTGISLYYLHYFVPHAL